MCNKETSVQDAIDRAGETYEAELDAMTPKEAMIMAYGMLWRDVRTSKKAGSARMVLKHQLTYEERKMGIRLALDAYGDVSESEII